MNREQFWTLVGAAHAASGGDMDRKCECQQAALLQLPLSEVLAFDAHFTEVYFAA